MVAMDVKCDQKACSYSNQPSAQKTNWQYISAVELKLLDPKFTYRTQVTSQIVHKETIFVSCEPKLIKWSKCTLVADGKITITSQNFEYSMVYTPGNRMHEEKTLISHVNEVKVNIQQPCPLTEVYHSKAIRVSHLTFYEDEGDKNEDDSNDENNNEELILSNVGAPAFTSTPITKYRQLSERDPNLFFMGNESHSYQYCSDSFDSFGSLFSIDSSISVDDVTDFLSKSRKSDMYKTEVLILGVNSKIKRYAKSKCIKGILKKRTEL